jgi:hypothetical protein
MVRQHGSLEKDAETNQAAWEAAKGAAWGGSKVRISIYVMFVWNSILYSLHLSCVRVSGFVKAVDEVPISMVYVMRCSSTVGIYAVF